MVTIKPSTETYHGRKPCRRCGTSLRYVHGRTCVECSKHHCKNYYARHPEKFEVYRARRNEKRKLTRARAAQLRKMNRPVTPMPKPSKALAYTMRGRAVRFKHKLVREKAMDMIEVKSPPPPIFGVMCAGESPDSIKINGGNGTLGEIYLAALLRRDAIIWNRRMTHITAGEIDDDDDAPKHAKPKTVAAPGAKYKSHSPCPKCRGYDRYVANKQCVTCAKANSQAFDKAHRRAVAKLAAERKPRPGLRGLRSSQVKVVRAEPQQADVLKTFGPLQPRWGED